VWCVGLKDGFALPQAIRPEFDKMLRNSRERMPMVQIEVDEARALLAGAIRFSRQNGFRLPPGWERWAGIFGKLDTTSADLSEFGKDGKLLYIGTTSFLRKRLIGSVDEFFAQPDVDYLMRAPGSPDMQLRDDDDQ